jgi:hypothetical protein
MAERQYPAPQVCCDVNGCAFLKEHEGVHSWE